MHVPLEFLPNSFCLLWVGSSREVGLLSILPWFWGAVFFPRPKIISLNLRPKSTFREVLVLAEFEVPERPRAGFLFDGDSRNTSTMSLTLLLSKKRVRPVSPRLSMLSLKWEEGKTI